MPLKLKDNGVFEVHGLRYRITIYFVGVGLYRITGERLGNESAGEPDALIYDSFRRAERDHAFVENDAAIQSFIAAAKREMTERNP